MSGATYLSKPAGRQLPVFRKLVPFVAAALAFMVAIISLGSGLFMKPQEAQAGPVEWVVCEWAGQDSIAYFAYEAAFTDNIAYLFNSKSAISAGTDDVAGGLNILLGLTHDFTSVNEAIMGTGLKSTKEYEGDMNGGTKVNPYDRFGVAGQYWSSYSGEWNYLKVDICGKGTEPVNMRIGAFYDGRLAPLSTWGGISQSTDVRSLAAAQKSLVVAQDWVNIVANGVFNITKFVVVVTNALIGVAFSDILSFIGLNDLLGSDQGIFTKFYNGLYLPLILIVMLIMASWAFWHGIVKRAYRRTLAGIAQSIFLFLMAAVVAFNPMFFITLPNNIAVIAQSLIVNTLSTSVYAGDGLCSVGGVYTVGPDGKQVEATADANGRVDTKGTGTADTTDVKGNLNLLEQASKSMQSVIGCQLWNTYVLKPWASGQFGTDVNNLWAKGHADTVINANAKELTNDNEAWVGDAAVPLGGGYTLNNWAIFQMSTQTNAHVTLGQEKPARATYTDGVANDWWRIVDAVSNYNETSQSNGIPSGCSGSETTVIEGSGNCVAYKPGDTKPVDSTVPDITKKPTDYWQNWIGAKPGDRMTAALGSVFPAIVGNLAPLAFAGMSAIFAIAIALAMAVAPIFLLLGSWPGNGWNMFKAWGQLVLNLMMKRIVAGVLLVLSLIFITMILELTKDNWFISFVVMGVVSIGLFKFRKQIFDKLAGIMTFNFANHDLGQSGAQAWGKFSNAAKQTAAAGGRMGTAAVLGSDVAHKAGQSRWAGVKAGAKQELRNTIYRSPTWNRAFMEAENLSKDQGEDQIISASEICAYCSRPLTNGSDDVTTFNGGQDFEGNFICQECMDNPTGTVSGINPYEHGARRVRRKVMNEENMENYKKVNFNDGRMDRHAVSENPLNITDSTMELGLDDLKASFKDPQTGETAGNIADLVGSMFAREMAIAERTGTTPAVPDQLKPYMNEETREIIPHLWKDNNPQAKEVIAYAYANAIANYGYDNGMLVGGVSGDMNKGVEGDVQVILGSTITAMNKRGDLVDEEDFAPPADYQGPADRPDIDIPRRFKDEEVFQKLTPAMRFVINKSGTKEITIGQAWKDIDSDVPSQDWNKVAKAAGWKGENIPLSADGVNAHGNDWSIAESVSMAQWQAKMQLSDKQKAIVNELFDRVELYSEETKALYRGVSVDLNGASMDDWLAKNYPVNEARPVAKRTPLVTFTDKPENVKEYTPNSTSQKEPAKVVFELETAKGIQLKDGLAETVLRAENFQVVGYETSGDVTVIKMRDKN